jgi:2-succinyl-5-enolpyruvyl-6-hydroxy-3-cyclohexene-1-carboxylate synthase
LKYQHIYDLVETCSRKGILYAVICPGSRSAPLTIAFANHPSIKSLVIPDERSAAFVALGIAQNTGMPVALVCTSGSAGYNFAPAIAEAFFQHIPLVVFTADRPPEMIDQLDGQTIRQRHLYGTHVKRYFELPVEEGPSAAWHVNRSINEAINVAQHGQPGPVHLNVPFREPFYPAAQESITFNKVRSIHESASETIIQDAVLNKLKATWKSAKKILIVAGQCDMNQRLITTLNVLQKRQQVPLVGELLTNLHGVNYVVQLADLFLGAAPDELKKILQPDLLITFGNSIVSKQVKTFLRQYAPTDHWHIQAHGDYADTYQSLTQVVRCTPEYFFERIPATDAHETFRNQKQNNYFQLWQAEEHRATQSKLTFAGEAPYGEFSLVRTVMESLPTRCNLHVANSMSIRYANWIGLSARQKGIRVFCNRGTSGIDGCTSTAVGHSVASEIPNILITGDMAFFYDRNAFWHLYVLPNLRVVVLNNHGGIIFNMIDGPAGRPEAQEYFVTHQARTAKALAQEYQFEYENLNQSRKWKNALKTFFEFNGKTKILELESDQQKTTEEFKKLKSIMKKSYG